LEELRDLLQLRRLLRDLRVLLQQLRNLLCQLRDLLRDLHSLVDQLRDLLRDLLRDWVELTEPGWTSKPSLR